MNKVKGTSALLITSLIGVGLVAGRLLPELILRFDRNVPVVGWGASVTLLIGAAILGGLAWSTWQSLHKKNLRMTSDHGVMLLALAKASALVAAIFAGGYGGYAVAYLGAFESPLGKDRVIHAGAGAFAGLLMLAAALVLEWALRVRTDEDDGDNAATDASPA